MRIPVWLLGFVTLFCISQAQSADTENGLDENSNFLDEISSILNENYNVLDENSNVLDEKINNERDWTKTKEYREAKKIVEEKTALMDVDDLSDFNDDISYCKERLDGGKKEMKHTCLNVRDFVACINGVGKDFFGYDIHTLAKIFWDDPVFGKRAQSFTSKYKWFQQVCTEDTTFRDKIKTDNCFKMVDFQNLLPGGSKKIKDACSNLLKYFDCKDKFIMDNLGENAESLATLRSATALGKTAGLYVSTKAIIQDMCSQDSILLEGDDIVENEDIAQCMKILDIESFLAGKFHKMDDFCPNAFNYLKCLDKAVKNALGFDAAIVAKVYPDTSDLGKYSRLYMKLKSIVKGVCPKEAALFKDDVDGNKGIVECLKMTDIGNWDLDIKKKLEDLCPNILNFTNCMEEYVKEGIGNDIAFLEKLLSGTNSGNALKLFTNMKNIVQEFCSKDSDLYRDYKMDEECFESVYLEEMDVCKNESKVVYEKFRKMMNYKDAENKDCFQKGVLLTCMGDEIREKCGKRAFNTYSEAINKSDILRLKYCSKTEFEDFKTSFLGMVKTNDDQPEFFHSIFN